MVTSTSSAPFSATTGMGSGSDKVSILILLASISTPSGTCLLSLSNPSARITDSTESSLIDSKTSLFQAPVTTWILPLISRTLKNAILPWLRIEWTNPAIVTVSPTNLVTSLMLLRIYLLYFFGFWSIKKPPQNPIFERVLSDGATLSKLITAITGLTGSSLPAGRQARLLSEDSCYVFVRGG